MEYVEIVETVVTLHIVLAHIIVVIHGDIQSMMHAHPKEPWVNMYPESANEVTNASQDTKRGGIVSNARMATMHIVHPTNIVKIISHPIMTDACQNILLVIMLDGIMVENVKADEK